LTSFRQILALLLLSGITFFISNFLLNGSLNKTNNLSGELKSNPDSLYQWKIATEPPFKYRVLHRIIVSTTYNLVRGREDNNQTFFLVYQVEAFVLHFLAVILFYIFLTKIDLSEFAFVGSVFFVLLPPMLLAYNVPVHTREDPLAYCILTLGLLAIIKNNASLILLFAILGVLCRETLLLLPFVNLFFNGKQNQIIRLGISALAFGAFISLRFYYGMEKYDYWEGFNWNRNNLEQVLGFAYLTFGFLWIPFAFSFINKRGQYQSEIIYRSAMAVFFLILVTTFMGGIFNEIRILYLLAPWVIPIGLFYFKNNKAEILQTFRSVRFQLCAGLLLIVFVVITAYAISIVNRYVTSKFDIPYGTWIITAAVQLYFGMLCLPYFYVTLKKRIKPS
jgi:hypothetical protein